MSAGMSARRPLVLGAGVIAVLLGGLIGWGTFTRLAGAVVAVGSFELDGDRQVVQHRDGGVVAELLVAEGDLVAAGAPLIRLDPAELANELAIVENEFFELVSRRGRLESERDDRDSPAFEPELLDEAARHPEIAALLAGQRRLFAARRDSLQRELDELGQRAEQTIRRIEGIDAQSAAVAEQLGLMAADLEAQRRLLDRGLTHASHVRQLEREHAELRGMQGALAAAKSEAGERLTEARITAIRLEAERREAAIAELRDLDLRIFEISERRRALGAQLGRLEIRAPVAGVVHGLSVHTVRAVIRPAEQILQIVPQDRSLVARVRIEPVHIEQVYPGQPAVVHLPSFDRQSVPNLAGEVVRVSPDTFSDDRSGATFYRAEIRLDWSQGIRLPAAVQLVPGMPVTAFIRTSDRTPLEYLVSPLARFFARSMRES